jgi:dCTP diphosphatase
VAGFAELQKALAAFYDEREWRAFQTPKDIAASLAIEAAEIQELFLWLDTLQQQQVLVDRKVELRRELADVMINCLNLAFLGEIDLEFAVREKLALLEEKVPHS